MPESSIYDYLAAEDDAVGRRILEMLHAGLLNAPIAAAMVDLGIPLDLRQFTAWCRIQSLPPLRSAAPASRPSPGTRRQS